MTYSKLLSIVLLLLVAACGGGTDEVVEDPGALVQVEDFRYVLVPGGARFVSGKLRNLTAEPIRNAQIQIALYDEDNRLVTTMRVLVRDLEPDQQKAFRQVVDAADNIRGARVRSVLVM